VEAFQRGEHERAARIYDELFRSSFADPWTRVQVAAGLLGRMPWGGYPFPDY
jgi:hypothetical protein